MELPGVAWLDKAWHVKAWPGMAWISTSVEEVERLDDDLSPIYMAQNATEYATVDGESTRVADAST